MSTGTLSASPEMRKEAILRELERQGACSVEEMAARFDVHPMTIRRDLTDLAEAGRIVRTHGGAAPAPRVSFQFRFLEKTRQNSEQKQAIARAAADMVKDGECVVLDSSTTTLAIAQALIGKRDLTVITTSLPIASALFGIEGMKLILLGGILRDDSPDLVGSITESNLDQLSADIAFIGADGIDLEGRLYNASPSLGRMLGMMGRTADRTYAVADASKIGHRALLRFASLKDWDGLITDDAVTEEQIKKLRDHGVKLHITTPQINTDF